jgi:thiamine biosynthesis lipoprotein
MQCFTPFGPINGGPPATGAVSMTSDELIRFPFFAMGSPCELTLCAGTMNDPASVAGAVIAEIERIEQCYSRYRSDSIISAVNVAAREGVDFEVDPETANLIDHAFDVYRRSDGLFDITSGVLRNVWNKETRGPPDETAIQNLLDRVGLHKVAWKRPQLSFAVPGMEFDFGGIAKEYAADRAAAVCRSLGAGHGVVELGGDLALIGPNPDGSPWRIGVRDPRDRQTAIATLFVGDGGVATSGDYERFWEFNGRRYGHILNPRTGWPVEGLLSVTVAAVSCLEAGALSTVAILKGEEGASWLKDHAPAHLYVDGSGRLGGSVLKTVQSAFTNRSELLGN